MVSLLSQHKAAAQRSAAGQKDFQFKSSLKPLLAAALLPCNALENNNNNLVQQERCVTMEIILINIYEAGLLGIHSPY